MRMVAHQNVGINRCGVYLEAARTKGPDFLPTAGRQDVGGTAGGTPALRGGRDCGGIAGETPAVRNEIWRRTTGFVGAAEFLQKPEERRAGLRRLMKQIEKLAVAGQLDPIQMRAPECGIGANWGGDIDGWQRTRCAGRSVESICVQLGISRGRLTGLTKEYCAMPAGEVLDGYKIRGLKRILVGQVREAAGELWGAPGYFAETRCHGGNGVGGLKSIGASGRQDAGGTAGGTPALRKRSRYFRTKAWEFHGVMPADEERMRTAELLGKLDVLRDENNWSEAALATQLGFESAAGLRRACLNVMGRTLGQLERMLAWEVVRYYLAAEERELRTLAQREDVLGFRAREVYGSGEEAPREPFLDAWTAYEAADAQWLEMMRKELG